MPSVLQNTLSPDLVNQRRVYVNTVFNQMIENTTRQALLERSKTLGAAKSLTEFYSLVKTAIDNYEARSMIQAINKVTFTEEEPDIKSQTETISFSLVKREPGAFSQGAPFEGKTRNLRPIQREVVDDPKNPGYKLLTTGYWHDNMVRFTCWARTNKAANARALWFEAMMEEFSWWFKVQGVDRVLFSARSEDITLDIDKNRWYGRKLDYFVRTETLRVISEKTIDEMVINLGVVNG